MTDRRPKATFRPDPIGRSAATRKSHWFADLKLTRTGLYVRQTGRRIGLNEIAPAEFAKFCSYLAIVLVRSSWIRLTKPHAGCVHFTPDRPRPWYIIWSAMALSGMRFESDAEKADAVFYFEDATFGTLPEGTSKTLLNSGCLDISKSNVAGVFEEVFGYPLALDPMCFKGQAVMKSETNGVHDGQIIDCPVSAKIGMSYQRFIDSSKDGVALDYRTTIVGRIPQFVLVKTKPVDDRFSMHNHTVVFSELADVFSTDEISSIERFATLMQLDWAALDVLRDAESGKIYIVDVNKTDTGPAVDLSWKDRFRVMRILSSAFANLIETAGSSVALPVPAQIMSTKTTS